jgi:hypothetical protein
MQAFYQVHFYKDQPRVGFVTKASEVRRVCKAMKWPKCKPDPVWPNMGIWIVRISAHLHYAIRHLESARLQTRNRKYWVDILHINS